jgi:hypothetical protein
MYLDETILQSRTTQTLVEFIDELFEWLADDRMEQKKYEELHYKYHQIKEKATKASKKRSFK